MSLDGQSLSIHVPGRDPETVRLTGDGPFPLGRAPDNTIVVNDSAVSRKHAEIVRRGEGYWIQDLKSKNGTKVNGTLIQAASPLQPGDRIDIGPCQIHFGRERGPGSSARVADTKAPGTVHAVPLADLVSASQSVTNLKAIAATNASPQRMAQFFEGMERLGPALLAHKPMSELFQFIVDLTSETLRCDRTVLVLRGEDGNELIPKATKQRGGSGQEIVVSRSIARRAIEDRTAILTSDAQSDERFKEQQSVIRQRINSAMCVPLWHDEEVLGVLYVDNLAPVPYEHTDLLILTHIGHLAAVKILETKSLEELQRRRQMEEELKRAANLQQSLLPAEPLLAAPYRVAGKNVPSQDVGGDYFDFIEGETPVLTIGLGDVAGKGMPAALLMTSLHASVRAHVESQQPLPLVMARLNRSIHQAVRGERFITLVLISIDRASGEFRYVNAGHNPPFLVHPSGEIEKLSVGGLLLGMFPEATYESAELKLEPGDVLTLYSDGVTEARNAADDEYGEERLAAFLTKHRTLEPERIVESLIREVFEFSNEGKPGDDVTVTVIRRD
ncbi:MAG TPA: SpoIIE family protein phosphatase [Candidatus Polarisedimenticolia bacterium]|nr:SpoIIE family protein phosphatase [Candidatus Polarisedimenticolia bacterium]